MCVALGRGIGGLEADFYLGWATFVKKTLGKQPKNAYLASLIQVWLQGGDCASVNKLPLKLAIVLKKNTV